MKKNLISRIKKGDKQAFRVLYDEYYAQAMRTAYSMTRNQNDADDAVQETFIRVYKNIQSFDASRPFKPWFYQILINEVRRILAKRKSNVDIDAIVHDDLQVESNEADFVEKQLVHTALNQMNGNHREVLVLKYINDFSEKEISDQLNITVGAVKSRLFQARKKLQHILRGFENE